MYLGSCVVCWVIVWTSCVIIWLCLVLPCHLRYCLVSWRLFFVCLGLPESGLCLLPDCLSLSPVCLCVFPLVLFCCHLSFVCCMLALCLHCLLFAFSACRLVLSLFSCFLSPVACLYQMFSPTPLLACLRANWLPSLLLLNTTLSVGFPCCQF